MQDCIFCKIVNKEIEAGIIFENDHFVIFPSDAPAAEKHFLLVPKKHVKSVVEVQEQDKQMLGEILYLASQTAKDLGIIDYKLHFNAGKYARVPHLHLHLLSGEDLEDKT